MPEVGDESRYSYCGMHATEQSSEVFTKCSSAFLIGEGRKLRPKDHQPITSDGVLMKSLRLVDDSVKKHGLTQERSRTNISLSALSLAPMHRMVLISYYERSPADSFDRRLPETLSTVGRGAVTLRRGDIES